MVTVCHGGCRETPGTRVRFQDGSTGDYCFTCLQLVRERFTVRVIDWINKHGKLQFGNAE
jgi:hypothetical protein